MHIVHELIQTAAFDLYELHLFQLVVKHRSFTKASEIAGITQSAMTRQMQGLETSIGLDLLERTTRSVRLTSAGEFLHREASRLLGDAEQALQRLHEQFSDSKKEIRVGVSRSLCLAHLPGFFHANIRHAPQVGYRISSEPSASILTALELNELDIGVLSKPEKLPATLRVTHRFKDAFTLIASDVVAEEFAKLPKSGDRRAAWASRQNWLLLDKQTNTGQRLNAFVSKQGWTVDPIMQLDSFDMIINLVSLGMGVSFVPIRALALYSRKKNIKRIKLPVRFVRELVVVIRQHRKMPDHFTQFIENILF
jgi:DNA-binding transcriptional LysR family regulator